METRHNQVIWSFGDQQQHRHGNVTLNKRTTKGQQMLEGEEGLSRRSKQRETGGPESWRVGQEVMPAAEDTVLQAHSRRSSGWRATKQEVEKPKQQGQPAETFAKAAKRFQTVPPKAFMEELIKQGWSLS